MKLLNITISSLFVLGQAIPLEERHDGHCISDQNAKSLINEYLSLFNKIDDNLAKKILTSDFTEYSRATNFLAGVKGGVTSSGRDAFIAAQHKAQAAGFTEQFIIFDADHTCNKIYFRWRTAGDEDKAFYGFDEMYLSYEHGCWKINKDYSEWDNAIALFNAGLFPCTAQNSPTPGT